jgi:predicted TIM-barrel fold metal-dependent hydrolase
LVELIATAKLDNDVDIVNGPRLRATTAEALTNMAVTDLPRISADAHVDEPHDLWYERMDADLRDKAPRRIQAEADGGWSLVVDGSAIGWSNVSAEEAAQKDADRVAAAAPDVRHEMMAMDRINGEIIFPTIGLYTYNIEDPNVGKSACVIYNDWLREQLAGDPRIKLAMMIPTWDTDMAIAEVERVASDGCVGGLLLPLVGTPDWNHQTWEPLWSAIEQAGLPAVMHQGTGHDMIFYRGWGSPTANLLTTQSMAPRAAALLSCGGVFERHPDLHVVMVEVNAGWIGWTMSTLDEYYLAHQENGWTKPVLAELPSHYLKRQLHATFQDDPIALHNIPFTGTDCLLWGNDYPHPESTYPNSGKVLKKLLANVSEDDARAVVSGNALQLFGFDPVVLADTP